MIGRVSPVAQTRRRPERLNPKLRMQHAHACAYSTSEDEREGKEKERDLKRKADHGDAKSSEPKSIYVDKVLT